MPLATKNCRVHATVGKHSVLLVDDDLEILEMFRKLLRREPYDIRVAANAEEALTLLAQTRFAAVVSDERMPGMNGTELLERVRLEHPSVIRMMVTGQSAVDAAMRAIHEGQVYRFLLKPVGASALGSAIRDALTEFDLRLVSEASQRRERRREEARAQLETQWKGLSHLHRRSARAAREHPGTPMTETLELARERR